MVTRYVNTASTAGGDGTTNATVGANRAFATAGEAQGALAALNAADDVTLWCEGSTDDASVAVFSGSYVQAGFVFYIRGNQSGGIFDSSRYVKKNDPGGSNAGLAFTTTGTAQRFNISGLQFLQDNTDGISVYLNASTTAIVTVEKSIFKVLAVSSYGAVWARSTACVCNVLDSVFSDAVGDRAYGIKIDGSGAVRNCLVRGFINGINGPAAVSIVNCSVFDSLSSDMPGLSTIDHCASDDGTGTNPVTVVSWASQFYNPNYVTDLDFRLKANSILVDAGVGPSVDALVPTSDIVDVARSGTTSSVGPFEDPVQNPTRVTVVVVG